MAKKNTITISVIIVVIMIAYMWLTGTNQWGDKLTTTNQTNIPQQNNHINQDELTFFMQVTALIPFSETFESIIDQLPMTTKVEVDLQYIDQEDFSFQNYINFLLTHESGDIHLIPNEWVLPLAVQGYIMPLDRVVTTEYIEEQTPALVESMKWNSSIWAAPYQLDPYIVVPHQSISAYFEEQVLQAESEVIVETVEVVLEAGEKNEQLLEEIIIETSKRYDRVKQIINAMTNDDILINLAEPKLDYLFHFLYYIERSGITNGQILTSEQTNLLSILYDNQAYISERTIEEVLDDKTKQPLFLVLKWSELSKHIELINQYYQIEQIDVPIYWTNGYSFVIKQQSKQYQVAGQWIEALQRKMSDSHITNVGMPIHKSNMNRLNIEWQKKVSGQFLQQYDSSSAMVISPTWPIYYEQLQAEWALRREIVEQLEYWLNNIRAIKDLS